MQLPVIELKNISKAFTTEHGTVNALEDVSLTIEKGDIFGIIGASGAGKSTLVRCINFLEIPTSGEVLFMGQPLGSMPNKVLRETRRKMGMIFQQFNLLMQKSVLDNVAFPLVISGMKKEQAREKAVGLLERVGLSDKLNAFPSQLSGGQKQRVAIARAISTDPQILLCDEATSALDPETTSSILALLKDINNQTGITVIIITHEMRVVEEICNRVAIMDSSKIAETGEVKDVFSNPKTTSAKRLVFPDGDGRTYIGERCCRVVFDGNSSFEPVIANIVLEGRAPVNILFADTKNIDGKAYGQMILQLPKDDISAERMMRLIKAKGLSVEEVSDDVG